jgi:hypothetical protein
MTCCTPQHLADAAMFLAKQSGGNRFRLACARGD